MTHLLYNFLVALILPFIFPFLLILLIRKKYRTGILNRLGIIPAVPNDKDYVIWFHAVSVGEVMAAIPLIKAYRKKHPDCFILLSTVTVTGNNTARQKVAEIDSLIYFPFDFIWSVKFAIKQARPNIFIFFETEIWPNILHQLKTKDIPTVLVNGRLTQRSFGRYQKLGSLWRDVLNDIDFISVQTQKDFSLYSKLGISHTKLSVTGNMKYEQVLANPGVPPEYLNNLHQNIFIAGSTHEGEEKVILDGLKLLKKGLIFPIIAPRHPERFARVEELIKSYDFNLIKRSDITPTTILSDYDILMIDTIGELNGSYKFAKIVFIGGSLIPVGGHNILEAASWGKMICFGPYMANIADISEEFIRRDAAIMLNTAKELADTISMLMADNEKLSKMGLTGLEIVRENQGAVVKNIEILDRYIKC